MTHKILIVDDEPDILEFLGYNLRKEGYEVFTCENGADAIKLAKEHQPQLILLDVMMPVMDGIETCTELRKNDSLKNTVIAFLTARNEDYSQVAGFDAGGDDYIAKPIKPKVLMSRIKALLRRNIEPKDKSGITAKSLIKINDLIIDRDKYIVIKNNIVHNLPRKEFELLNLLVSKPNRVFTRDEIFSSIWGNDIVVGDRTIDVHIRKIRERLDCKNIKTIKGVGYKFESD
jgi:two-component system, OmpR family, alkaline phosphatase synthesis response regulator PhoP